jgi:Rod binding domain-containing protein
MTDLSATAATPDLAPHIPTVPTGPAATRDRIAATAKSFESSFISTMFNSMFASLPTDGLMGGGPGEDAFKSFLSEAVAKQVVKHGGIGLAPTIQKEMLKMQGLSPDPASPTPSIPTLRVAQTAYAGVTQ